MCVYDLYIVHVRHRVLRDLGARGPAGRVREGSSVTLQVSAAVGPVHTYLPMSGLVFRPPIASHRA